MLISRGSKSTDDIVFMACSFVTHLSSLTVSFGLDMRLSPLNRAIFSLANRVSSPEASGVISCASGWSTKPGAIMLSGGTAQRAVNGQPDCHANISQMGAPGQHTRDHGWMRAEQAGCVSSRLHLAGDHPNSLSLLLRSPLGRFRAAAIRPIRGSSVAAALEAFAALRSPLTKAGCWF
jgi:hypothetical protein